MTPAPSPVPTPAPTTEGDLFSALGANISTLWERREMLVALHTLLLFIVLRRLLHDVRHFPRRADASTPERHWARAAYMTLHRGHAWVLLLYEGLSFGAQLWAHLRRAVLSNEVLLVRACLVALWTMMLVQQQLGSLNPLRRGQIPLDELTLLVKLALSATCFAFGIFMAKGFEPFADGGDHQHLTHLWRLWVTALVAAVLCALALAIVYLRGLDAPARRALPYARRALAPAGRAAGANADTQPSPSTSKATRSSMGQLTHT